MSATSIALKYGFPTVVCYRCAGSGHYSRNYQGDTTCYGCDGLGVSVKRGKAAKALDAFLAAQPKRQLAVADLVAGDKIARDGRWVEVLAVLPDFDSNAGSSTTTTRVDGVRVTTVELRHNFDVYLAGDVVWTVTGSLAVRRMITADMIVDPAPYLAAAGVK